MDNLDKYLVECGRSEFEWSKQNCGHFSSKWVLLNEGFDPLEGIEFPTTLEGVLEVVAKYGSVEQMISAVLKRGSISPAFAIRGDIVMAPTPAVSGVYGTGAMIGICNGSTAVFLREGSGVTTLRMRVTTRAWRIAQ